MSPESCYTTSARQTTSPPRRPVRRKRRPPPLPKGRRRVTTEGTDTAPTTGTGAAGHQHPGSVLVIIPTYQERENLPLIVATLVATRGNQIRAAELLGLNRNTLRKKLRELDLQPSRGAK